MLHDPAGLSPPACYAYNSLQTDRQFSRIDNRSRGTVPILAVEAIWTMKNGLLPQKWAVPCCRQGGACFRLSSLAGTTAIGRKTDPIPAGP